MCYPHMYIYLHSTYTYVYIYTHMYMWSFFFSYFSHVIDNNNQNFSLLELFFFSCDGLINFIWALKAQEYAQTTAQLHSSHTLVK